MWADILNKSLKVRVFKEFRKEQINWTVEYEDKSNCECVGKTTGLSKKNVVQTGKYNENYRSYTEDTRATTKPSMNSPQVCVEGT